MDSFLDELLADPAAVWPLAANVCGWPLIGAAGWAGGWLVVAPGTPAGGVGSVPLVLPPIAGCAPAPLSGVWFRLVRFGCALGLGRNPAPPSLAP